ncbi:hypothetical protein [Teredinibacter purpureus]|uniref:hypothetical protein n=1 Tax=Teredinibacter purpureus TaxID=2731756 RepID=UPI0006975579|nr:hypothetical protein [Teredinibacter purpureus]
MSKFCGTLGVGNRLYRLHSIGILLFVLSLVIGVAPASYAGNENTAENIFSVWSGGNFHRFIVNKTIDFSKYDQIIVLPINTKELVISDRARYKIRRNWKSFAEKDMPAINERFLELAALEFSGKSPLLLTDKGGKSVLAVQIIAKEVMPRAFRDTSLATVGKQSVEQIATLQYQIVLTDTPSRGVVAMIEGDLLVAPRNGKINNRSMHFRAWERAWENLLEKFNIDLAELQSITPLKE